MTLRTQRVLTIKDNGSAYDTCLFPLLSTTQQPEAISQDKQRGE
ncbi:hypothetical protein MCHI_003295 [Candidatus Magnetoovum chiemensis]|nr:hypothetical protein MCHI_003295 [Candidatus Magnetoovum chiemensis]